MIAKNSGHSVYMLAGKEKNDRITSADLPIDAELPVVRKILPTKDFTALFSFSMLKNLWVRIRASEVVHISLAREAIPAASLLISMLMKRKVILQPHGMLTARSSNLHKFVDLFLTPLMRRADIIVALTHREELELRELYGPFLNPVEIIGNPVPQEAGAENSDIGRAAEAIFIARLHPRKRVLDFTGSAAMAHQRGWNDKYVIVGPDAGDLPRVEAAAKKLPNLDYEGAISGKQVTSRLARSAIFVLTSENEPWGNVLATALALGIPVIVPNSAALSPVVQSYNAGRVYDDGDVDAIAQFVHDLLNDQSAYDEARRNAYRLAEVELSPVVLQGKISNLYKCA
ncbi:glycosyltransferase family 4 protein [Kocuria oceani]|uniref:glycosyltransferase family 4 protein n=1 Tax=Kocuria oceani TaxID=988827 RepID=UPI004035AE48